MSVVLCPRVVCTPPMAGPRASWYHVGVVHGPSVKSLVCAVCVCLWHARPLSIVFDRTEPGFTSRASRGLRRLGGARILRTDDRTYGDGCDDASALDGRVRYVAYCVRLQVKKEGVSSIFSCAYGIIMKIRRIFIAHVAFWPPRRDDFRNPRVRPSPPRVNPLGRNPCGTHTARCGECNGIKCSQITRLQGRKNQYNCRKIM